MIEIEEKILFVPPCMGHVNMKAAVDIIKSMGGISCGVAPLVGGLLYRLVAEKKEFETFESLGVIEWV
jgi:hypothetical protein